MPFNVQEMSFSYTNFQKLSLPWEGKKKPPTPSPLSGHFAPLLWPPVTNPGPTTVTGIAKMHKGRGVDPGGGGGGGQTYRFAPPPPNNFANLENS